MKASPHLVSSNCVSFSPGNEVWLEMYHQAYLATLVKVFGGSLLRRLLKLHQTGGIMPLIHRIAQMYMK